MCSIDQKHTSKEPQLRGKAATKRVERRCVCVWCRAVECAGEEEAESGRLGAGGRVEQMGQRIEDERQQICGSLLRRATKALAFHALLYFHMEFGQLWNFGTWSLNII